VTGSVRGEMSTATATACGAPGVHVIRCGQCGMSIPIVQPVPSIVCPACHTSTSLESEWLSSVSVYAQQLRALETASWHAEESRTLVGLSDPKSLEKWASGWGAVLFFVPALTIFLIAYLVDLLELRSPPFLVLSGLVLLALLAPVALRGATKTAPMKVARWRYRWGEGRRLASTWVPPAKRVQCPACGAKVELGAGMAVDACSYCRASLAVAIHRIWRASWELVANARRQATARQPPSQFSRTYEALAQQAYRLGVLHDPWHQLLELSSWLGGQVGMLNLRWWLTGYWPEALPQPLFHDIGSFACGSARGYPVGVYVAKLREPLYLRNPGSRLWLVVFVGAVASPVDQRVNRDVSYYRTSAGYMLTALLPWSDATSKPPLVDCRPTRRTGAARRCTACSLRERGATASCHRCDQPGVGPSSQRFRSRRCSPAWRARRSCAPLDSARAIQPRGLHGALLLVRREPRQRRNRRRSSRPSSWGVRPHQHQHAAHRWWGGLSHRDGGGDGLHDTQCRPHDEAGPVRHERSSRFDCTRARRAVSMAVRTSDGVVGA
jgi:hypothetical protein